VERSSGKFTRRFRLPENAQTEQIKASMENGVLTVTVPKEEVKKPEVKFPACLWVVLKRIRLGSVICSSVECECVASEVSFGVRVSSFVIRWSRIECLCLYTSHVFSVSLPTESRANSGNIIIPYQVV
jgi:hypothetical protein